MVPIGRGEGAVGGDNKLKTALAIDAIIDKGEDVSTYVAIGQRPKSIKML